VKSSLIIFLSKAYWSFPVLLLLMAFSDLPGAELMKSGTAKVNGTSLYYEIAGQGAPLVLISGGGTLDRRSWDNQFEAFAKSYQVIRYDVRGIGKSAHPTKPFSHSQDLFELLKFLKIQKAHVIGLSFSGAMALDFALDHPEMVDRLVLIASGSSTDAKSKANLDALASLAALAKKDGLSKTAQLIADLPWFISPDNSDGREKVKQNLLDNNQIFDSDFALVRLWQPTTPPASERLREIRMPVLIVEAEKDLPAYREITAKLKLGIAGSKQVVIPGAAHLIHLDKPAELNQVILDFLKG